MPGFEYRYRAPRNTPQERGGRPPAYSRRIENKHAMLIERDVPIALRDGKTIYADVFRPADEAPYQALRMAVLDLVGQHDVPPAVFITGSPGRLSPDEPAPRHDHFLLSDMEESIAEVLAERLRTTDGGEDRLLALRAAVKARAGLAALRGLIAVDSSTPGAGTLSIEDLTLRVNEAFLALED